MNENDPKTSAAHVPSPEELEDELGAHLDLYVRAVNQGPRFCARPNVVPVVGAAGRFALVDPGSIDLTQPRAWQSQNAKSGLATKDRPHGQPVTRPVPGKPFPKGHPSARTYNAEELERMTSAIDPEASGLVAADALSEGLYDQIVKLTAESGVPAGARATFVLRFVTTRLDLTAYGKQSNDEAKALFLANHVKHAVAACLIKEPLFVDYDKKIADATAALSEASEAPEVARIVALEEKIAQHEVRIARLVAGG